MFLAQAYDTINIVSQELVEDKSWIDSQIAGFYSKLQEMQAANSVLLSLNVNGLDNATRNEYASLLNRGETLKNTIAAALNTIADIKAWLFGEDKNLGIAPVFVIGGLAAIGVAVAAITKWVSDVYLFERKITEINRLRASGVSAAQASEMIAKQTESMGLGIGDGLSKIAFIVAAIGVGYYLLKKS